MNNVFKLNGLKGLNKSTKTIFVNNNTQRDGLRDSNTTLSVLNLS